MTDLDTVRIGVVGAGARGQDHADHYAAIPGAEVVAVADIDEAAARALADEHGVDAVYAEHAAMLAGEDLDAVSVCVHNNLHAPITVDALEAGAHVFCEKPMAGSYADAARMWEAARDAGLELAVQNGQLFSGETRAARRLIEAGELGEVSYGRALYTRRRGRPYVDGYGTPAFADREVAGGGAVLDVGTYPIGRLLHLLGNAPVERVGGRTFDFTGGQFSEELVGENLPDYRERLDEVAYDVEDAGVGFARLADGSLLSVRAAWHMNDTTGREVVTGSRGGIQFDPFEYLTTLLDYEATVSLDVEDYERRRAFLESESGYDPDVGRRSDQFHHWIGALRGEVERVPTGEIALNSMRVMEGIYLSSELGRELSAEEVAERSESVAVDLD